eukprot:GDKK01038831.1.p1 GENE.GDKK01038831.1~~GDKK01038831.1.p1  ORF type:complete len:191 (+),score=49.33 GDKK01038831.1:48-575(+)
MSVSGPDYPHASVIFPAPNNNNNDNKTVNSNGADQMSNRRETGTMPSCEYTDPNHTQFPTVAESPFRLLTAAEGRQSPFVSSPSSPSRVSPPPTFEVSPSHCDSSTDPIASFPVRMGARVVATPIFPAPPQSNIPSYHQFQQTQQQMVQQTQSSPVSSALHNPQHQMHIGSTFGS